MSAKWLYRFELKPGRWVFVPSIDSVNLGREIKERLEQAWKIPKYHYHLRSGGHLSALRSHLQHAVFIRVDLRDFFGSLNRTRVTRSLKPFFGYDTARHWANASTVKHPIDSKRTIVPYGFVQSPIVASVCLRYSALGKYLQSLQKRDDLALSVYVDDIIISTDEYSVAESIAKEPST